MSNWVLGFVSAYNHCIYRDFVANEDGIFDSANPEAIGAWMDNYCSANPLSTSYAGSVELVQELEQMNQ